MIKNQKGYILIHVLITSVVVAIIAAGLMSVMMLQYQVTSRAEQGSKGRKGAEAGLSRIISSWNADGFCTDISGAYDCTTGSPSLATCTCACDPLGSMPELTVGPAGGPPPCTITLASPLP